MDQHKVLNHGYVGLVNSMGSDVDIVRSARVSYDADWRAGDNKGSDKRLIGYLMKNGHNTPFESVVVTIDVKAPIFVFRQWHRHRTQSYNELSARYRPLPNEWYVPDPWVIGTQSEDNKQMRDVMSQEDWTRSDDWTTKDHNLDSVEIIDRANRKSFEVYTKLLERGVPREIARSVLPVGMFSHMFATANLNNWYRFLQERLHEHAQHEIRVYAVEILKILEIVAPVATNAFKVKIGYKSDT